MAKKKSKQKSSSAAAAPPQGSTINTVHADAIEAARNTSTPPVFMKLCRLCEAKDGPFLNIFGVEQAIAKKIDILMPFTVSEYDDLPHKICFRCSAKVEELHEFVQKSITTQENLHQILGKKGFVAKSKARKLWEDKLTKSNMTNDDICNAVIEKAMAGIKDLPNSPLLVEEPPKKSLRSEKKVETVKETKTTVNNSNEIPKSSTENLEEKIVKPTRSTRASLVEPIVETLAEPLQPKKSDSTEIPKSKKNKVSKKVKPETEIKESSKKVKPETVIKEKNKLIEVVKEENCETIKIDFDDESDSSYKSKEKNPEKIVKSVERQIEPKVNEAEKPPFDIMSHVCTIKVNGVGILFQCKLCNRNFLNKDGVMSHGCAKTGVPKLNFAPSPVANIRPKNPVNNVKYITNNVHHKSQHVINAENAAVKSKPKIGPASKIKKSEVPSVGMRVTPREQTPPPLPPPVAPALVHTSTLPAIEVPPIPGMKNRYRLVPGPNNTFTLIEDSAAVAHPPQVAQPPQVTQPPQMTQPPSEALATKRKLEENKFVRIKKVGPKSKSKNLPNRNEDLVKVDSEPTPAGNIPYPVGLFQSTTSDVPIQPAKPITAPVTFTTPAMKKQSYTVVQTGNPSKLLISSKPQPPVEPPKPKSKRKAREERVEVKQPFKVTIEDEAPPKDSGFFTFINVDPLLQPSYVLPTDNIIQESQITSSAIPGSSKQGKDNYACSMCPEKFSREKKLLAHIQAHYNKIDEEARYKEERVSKKRKRS